LIFCVLPSLTSIKVSSPAFLPSPFATPGEATTASCVVFDKGLPKIKKYRQFNIKNITPGDDYAALNQAVFRRYSRLLKDKKPLPDVVFIDGGLGQLNQAIMVVFNGKAM
jgi:excinuclease ABC subunit C